jgi:hypothetical protein
MPGAPDPFWGGRLPNTEPLGGKMIGNPRPRTYSPQVTTKCIIHQELTAKLVDFTVSGFRIQAIPVVPADANLLRETRLLWADFKLGRFADFNGANGLYSLTASVVIATVENCARLTFFDGAEHVELPTGIWQISPEVVDSCFLAKPV